MTETWREPSPDAARLDRKARPSTPTPSPRTGQDVRPGWDGPTYYGRPQLKPAPFHKGLVGGYVFLAGLSGSSSLLSAIADLVGGPAARRVVRRGRRLALLAPTLGSALLIQDLHTPKRFYNMLRVFKPRSPMSVGSWILVGSAASSVPIAAADFLSDRRPRRPERGCRSTPPPCCRRRARPPGRPPRRLWRCGSARRPSPRPRRPCGWASVRPARGGRSN
jgi:hypothetical protein